LKIALFGSLFTGDIHEYSDVDLVVIKNSQKGFYERLKEVVLLVMSRRGADILVYTPEEAETQTGPDEQPVFPASQRIFINSTEQQSFFRLPSC